MPTGHNANQRLAFCPDFFLWLAFCSSQLFGWHFVRTISTCFGILSESWKCLFRSYWHLLQVKQTLHIWHLVVRAFCLLCCVVICLHRLALFANVYPHFLQSNGVSVSNSDCWSSLTIDLICSVTNSCSASSLTFRWKSGLCQLVS